MRNKISANKKVGRNSVFGRVYFKKTPEDLPGTESTYKKLRNKVSYGRRKKTYGAKGKSKVE